MRKRVVTKVIASALTVVLAAVTLTGCRFGFASDPDDPNEIEEKIPIDLCGTSETDYWRCCGRCSKINRKHGEDLT